MIRLGEHDLVIHEGREREYTVTRTITHPGYNRSVERLILKNRNFDFGKISIVRALFCQSQNVCLF